MKDNLYPDAVRVCVKAGYVSASLLRTALDVSYARAVSLIDDMERGGVATPCSGPGPRELVNPPARKEMFT